MKHYSQKRLLLLFGASIFSYLQAPAQAPTVLLKDINPGSGSGLSYNNASAELGGKVYFVADKDGYQDLVWVTDGTEAGTKQVVSNTIALAVEEMTANGSRVFFEGLAGSKPAIFVTNAAGNSALPLRLFDGREIFNLHARPQDGKVLFATESFAGGDSELWVSDGTGAGTVKLGDYTMKEEFMYYSPYLSKTIVTEQSTNWDQAPPVITDGTPAGTQLLKDALLSVANFYSIDGAIGTGDLLFVAGKVEDGGFLFNKAFAIDSVSKQEISLFGTLRRAFKSDNFYYLATDSELYRYDKATNDLTLLQDEYDYFGEPVLAGEKLYFTAKDNQVWETDGSQAGTRKLSVTGIGDFNYDPRIWVFGDSLFYFSDVSGKQIRMIDLNTSEDILFADVFQSFGLIVIPRLWKFGQSFVFPRYTDAAGYELWASPKPVTSVFGPAPAAEALAVSPNPSSGWCRLSPLPQGADMHIRVFDANGRVVANTVNPANGWLDLRALPPGIYTVQAVENNGKSYIGKVMKQ